MCAQIPAELRINGHRLWTERLRLCGARNLELDTAIARADRAVGSFALRSRCVAIAAACCHRFAALLILFLFGRRLPQDERLEVKVVLGFLHVGHAKAQRRWRWSCDLLAAWLAATKALPRAIRVKELDLGWVLSGAPEVAMDMLVLDFAHHPARKVVLGV